MSVISLLIIKPQRLPSFEAIKTAAEASGDEIEFHETVDLNSHTGFLPVQVRGRDTGFEYYFDPIPQDSLLPEAAQYGTHHIVTRTGSDFEEGRAALLFLKLAAHLSGGAYVYPDDATIVPPEEVQAYLEEQVLEFDEIILRNDEKAAVKATRDGAVPPPEKPRGFLSRLLGNKE